MTDRFVPGPDLEDDHTGVCVRMRWNALLGVWTLHYRESIDGPLTLHGDTWAGAPE